MATPHATERSNNTTGSPSGVPGGPAGYDACTGSVKSVANTTTAMPWAAWNAPMTMFQSLSRSRPSAMVPSES